MPAKKTKNVRSAAERRKRLEKAAKAHGTSDDIRSFERAFKKVVVARMIKHHPH